MGILSSFIESRKFHQEVTGFDPGIIDKPLSDSASPRFRDYVQRLQTVREVARRAQETGPENIWNGQYLSARTDQQDPHGPPTIVLQEYHRSKPPKNTYAVQFDPIPTPHYPSTLNHVASVVSSALGCEAADTNRASLSCLTLNANVPLGNLWKLETFEDSSGKLAATLAPTEQPGYVDRIIAQNLAQLAEAIHPDRARGMLDRRQSSNFLAESVRVARIDTFDAGGGQEGFQNIAGVITSAGYKVDLKHSDTKTDAHYTYRPRDRKDPLRLQQHGSYTTSDSKTPDTVYIDAHLTKIGKAKLFKKVTSQFGPAAERVVRNAVEEGRGDIKLETLIGRALRDIGQTETDSSDAAHLLGSVAIEQVAIVTDNPTLKTLAELAGLQPEAFNLDLLKLPLARRS